jgi:hypothetical protein
MNTNEFDYYFIESTGGVDVPLLECNDVDKYALDFLAYDEFAEIVTPVYLCFNEETTKGLKTPRMVDFHTLPHTVFSQKVFDVLSPMQLEGVQLVPAIITGNNGEEYKNYWILHTYKQIECFDKEKSIYKIGAFTKRWSCEKKVYLNKEALAEIPLEKRLLFVSKETSRFELYHKSIVDAIMAVNPEGLTFIPVEEWYEGVQFEQFK